MLDLTTLHTRLDAATDTLATTLADILVEAHRSRISLATEQPKQHVEPKAPPAASQPKPLLDRPNVHIVPSKPKAPVAPYTSTSLYEPRVRKQPPPEEIAKKAEKIVMTAGLPPTFERLRRALGVTKTALEPVIEQLAADNKIRVVEVGDLILYEPPRIEPIRRRRREHAAVAVATMS